MRFLLGCLLLFASTANDAHAERPQQRTYSVLLVGNSLTYTNNLPALLRAVGTANGTPIETMTFAAPGGTLSDRARDGAVLKALAANRFDAVVLQEQGGHLAACMAKGRPDSAPCAASLRAYRVFTAAARAAGARPFVFSTWGPDERWTRNVRRSSQAIAKGVDAGVFDAGGALVALKARQPGVNLTPDGSHPTTQASLLLALALYREITGAPPAARELRVEAPLLPVNAAVDARSPMESQATLRGDGKVTLIPATLLQPLIDALMAKAGQAG